MKTGDEFLFWTSLTVNGLQAFCLQKLIDFYSYTLILNMKFNNANDFEGHKELVSDAHR